MSDEAEQQGLEQAATPRSGSGKEKMTTYVVQRRVKLVMTGEHRDVADIEGAREQDTDLWQDVATVEVPLRSHRKTAIVGAIAKLTEEGKLNDHEYPMQMRALEAEVADPIPVRLEQLPAPEPVLKVGS